jgi:hypothetical protein
MEIQLRSEQVKASITLEFDNPASLYAAVDRLRGKDVSFTVSIPPTAKLGDLEPRPAIPVTPTGEVIAQPVVEKTRKPRADAGKPRGPYKTNGEPAASVPGAADATASAKPEAPATPANSAAPEKAPAEGDKPQPSGVVPATAAAEPTLDDARAALARINAVPGLGMEACLAHLAEFGTDRITLLKKEHYARFIAAADAKVAAGKAKK